MPAYSATDEALACKLVSFFPGNVKHGKPTHLANILLYDPKYGELKAVNVMIPIYEIVLFLILIRVYNKKL